jgi:hypothetical protein
MAKTTADRIVAARRNLPARGRPPRRVFINVLVRERTRTRLTALKRELSLASQGEVIDYLLQRAA